MKSMLTTHSDKPHKITANRYRHAPMLNAPGRKFHPASRTERLASWNRRMQSLFTRQAY